MSWDILLQRFPESVSSPDEAPQGFVPPAFGSRSKIQTSLKQLFKSAAIGSSSQVTISGKGYVIEIHIDDDPCSQILMHVHDDAEKALKSIAKIARHFQLRAVDCSTGEFIGISKTGHDTSAEQGKAEFNRKWLEKVEAINSSEQPWLLAGLKEDRCEKNIYLSFKVGETPARLQKDVFKHWQLLYKQHGDTFAGIRGPSWLLTLPDGEMLGAFTVAKFPSMVTHTEEAMIPFVEKAADLLQQFVKTTNRNSGIIENDLAFVVSDGREYALSDCSYHRLASDADFATKVGGKK